jgi:DNA polymerase-3 subunit beta
MKAKVAQQDLARLTGFASRAVSTSPGLAVLTGIKLEAVEHEEAPFLRATATDRDITLVTSVSAEVLEPGVEIVPGKLFAQAVKAQPAEELTLASSSGKVEVRRKRGKMSVKTMEVEDFPSLEVIADEQAYFEVEAKVLAGGLTQVLPSSLSPQKPELEGVRLVVESDRVWLASTDTYRMAIRAIDLPEPTLLPEQVAVTLPPRAAEEAQRALADSLGPAQVRVGKSRATIACGPWSVSTRFMSGEYPDLERLIPDPDNQPNTLKADREQMIEVIRRVGLFAQNNLPVRVSPDDNVLFVSANTPDVGDGEDSIDCEYEGKAQSMAFGPEYLIDGLAVLGSDTAVLTSFDNPLKPAVLRGSEPDGFTYVVMPVKVVGG